jgi:hypothetical protein
LRTVHYLCRLPGTFGKLVYPLETEEHYQTVGSFFLSGALTGDLDQSYTFPAYQNGLILPFKIKKLSGIAYAVEVPGLDQFIFDAKKVGVPAKYAGRYPFPDNGTLVRQLIPRDKAMLETAALENDIVFLGYSPRLDEDGTPPPIEPITPQLSTGLTESTERSDKQQGIETSELSHQTGSVKRKTAAKAQVHVRNR